MFCHILDSVEFRNNGSTEAATEEALTNKTNQNSD